jgi:hypothetical protein
VVLQQVADLVQVFFGYFGTILKSYDSHVTRVQIRYGS